MKRSSSRSLFLLISGFAACGILATLIYTIGWMIWYERTTGYDPGNAPMVWIFFLGPAGTIIGAFVGLIVWLLGKWFLKKLRNNDTAQ